MKKKTSHKIAVAMSGGLDSCVTAKLLQEEGHEVVGFFLKFWHEPATDNLTENSCCSVESYLEAKKICQQINIPLYTINYEDIFKKEVVDYFITTYANGKTPNPCLICNAEVKLGSLITYIKNLGFDYLATGHYARLLSRAGQYFLVTAKDKIKDQAYFLSLLNQNQLASLLFPLGNYTKKQVRALAKKWGWSLFEKKESQEVCFINSSVADFLQRHLTLTPGVIKNQDDFVLGTHQGLPLYTIGQRHGLNLGGGQPYYVLKKDLEKNELLVSNQKKDLALYGNQVVVKNIHWLSYSKIAWPLKCLARHRSQTELTAVEVFPLEKNIFLVKFKKPVRALTPGQFVVFYQPLGLLAKLNNKYEILGAGEIISDKN